MRIAVVNLTAGGISGGYRKYLRNVIPRLYKNPRVEAMLIASSFPAKENDLYWNSQGVKTISCKPYKFFGIIKDYELTKDLDEFYPDVVFVPTERYFAYDKAPVVIMLQNMEPFVKQYFNNMHIHERVKNIFKAIDGRYSIKNSTHVIAISEFVREFLISCCGINSKHVGLVYHGVDSLDTQPQKPLNFPHISQFIFTAGSIRPARGLDDLFMALSNLSQNGFDVPHMVIAGDTTRSMKAYKKKLNKYAIKNSLQDRIHWVGNLDDKGMTWCYKSCSAFVMTSRVEACPFTALEAMKYHCTIISSDSLPMPEIFGNTATYYNYGSGESLAEAIRSLDMGMNTNTDKCMSALINKQLAKYSWDTCARKTFTELKYAINYKKQCIDHMGL
jgi:glycosyltransferase involved in cell wall biosynthesis